MLHIKIHITVVITIIESIQFRYYLMYVLLVFVVDSEDVMIKFVDKSIKDDFFDDDIIICVGVQVNPIIKKMG